MTEEPVSDPVAEPVAEPVTDVAGDVGAPGDVVDGIEESMGDDRPERTGMEGVDSVIDDVAALGDRPVEEHAEVFESAHERLRRTLDQPPADPES